MKLGSSTRKYMVETWTSGDPHETYHPSQPAAYRKVQEIRDELSTGTSRVTGVTVKKWEDGRWVLFEKLTKEELVSEAPEGSEPR